MGPRVVYYWGCSHTSRITLAKHGDTQTDNSPTATSLLKTTYTLDIEY
ncbi:MAG TPA: hypothetical protein VIW47_14260 [Nitrospiraceae bacterium]